MKVVIQRVKRAHVQVEGSVVGQIGVGLLLLVGFRQGDTESCIAPMVEKIAKMRIFPNDAGRFDKDVTEINGEILAISQFTLFADTSKRRPGFFDALDAKTAAALYDQFVESLRKTAVSKVATGIFGAMMEVELVNDGPVTIIVEQ